MDDLEVLLRILFHRENLREKTLAEIRRNDYLSYHQNQENNTSYVFSKRK